MIHGVRRLGIRSFPSAAYQRHCFVPTNHPIRKYATNSPQDAKKWFDMRSGQTYYYLFVGVLFSSFTVSYFIRPAFDARDQPQDQPLTRDQPPDQPLKEEPLILRSAKWPDLGISQISVGSCKSNNPGEDAVDVRRFVNLKGLNVNLGCFGIYDGHNGHDLSNALCYSLLPSVIEYVDEVYQKHYPPSNEVINMAIKFAFHVTDIKIVHLAAQLALGLEEESYKKLNGGLPGFPGFPETTLSNPDYRPQKMSKQDAVKMLGLANAGSCAMVGVFDATNRSLRIGLTGDLRAVFGRRVLREDQTTEGKPNKTYVYEVEALTADQNASNPSEAARLSSEHPDEEDLLKNGRVLGWGPSRAFGDGVMKWSRAVRERLAQECLGDRPRENYKTPPYFTAEPVITLKEGIQKGDFVIFATDGLWECFENEEAVGLVGQWLEKYGTKVNVEVPGTEKGKEIMVPPSSSPPSSEGTLALKKEIHTQIYTPSDLPVIYPPDFKDNTPRYRYWNAEKKFVCEDKDSVARHLIRNALGGADGDLFQALLEHKPPRSRRFRDDITVVVVFFD